ncbi:MAG: flagellar basal body P-ring protein FlgI [Planctomycetaceae bacterium]|jgi:flagellar basal body P-ring protein FlgI|nr:flagellar basal body P-ring protein FlgI [Planctomycetaceae bacterium]
MRFFVFFVTFILLTGCSNVFSNKDKQKNALTQDQLAKEIENGKTMLVGDYAAVGNYAPLAVRGFGLVVGLSGTGSEDANSLAYKEVYDDMNRRGIQGIRDILASPTTAVVEILGYLRPGCRNGDRFDVQVMLPPETTAKSLRGGKLLTTKLREMSVMGGQLHESKTHAAAEGPIIVDDPLATEAVNPTGLKKGAILNGGSVREPRTLSLVMKTGSESAFITDRIAKEINHRFFISGSQRKGIANAVSDSVIILDIHPSYANDTSRYVRIVQSIACYENPGKQQERIERLKTELLNPETSQKAAFQLEAIGKSGIESLKPGLQSSDTEVRFHSATSLAHLGDGTSAKTLTEIARNEPAFRVYALNALGVMQNDLEAEMSLRELLNVPSAETRYGAFRALKTRNPFDPAIRGEVLGEQYPFSYHGVTTNVQPMVHISLHRQPEVVLFGSDIMFRQPFSLDAGTVIFINGQTPGTVTVNRFAVSGVDEKRTVPNRVDSVIRAVVDLGGTYPDIVQMLRQADAAKVLTCRLEIDCLPQPNREYRRNNSSGETETSAEEPKQNLWQRINPKNIFAPNPGGKSSDYEGTTNVYGRE